MNENPNHENAVDNSSRENEDSCADVLDEGTEAVEDEEFSLAQLSEAYAQVIKNRKTSNRTTDASPTDTLSPLENGDVIPSTPPEERHHPLEDVEESKIDDDVCCPISPSSILESILFVGSPRDVKLTSRKIAAVMRDVSPSEVTTLAKALAKRYEQENSAYRIVWEKGVLRMDLHPDMIPLQNQILGRDRATKLTQQAIDILAIVAYNQPVTREQVDQIRARPSGNIINQMIKRNLLRVEVQPSSDRKKRFWTTDRFLDLFGLEAIDDLPQSHDVSDIDELAD